MCTKLAHFLGARRWWLTGMYPTTLWKTFLIYPKYSEYAENVKNVEYAEYTQYESNTRSSVTGVLLQHRHKGTGKPFHSSISLGFDLEQEKKFAESDVIDPELKCAVWDPRGADEDHVLAICLLQFLGNKGPRVLYATKNRWRVSSSFSHAIMEVEVERWHWNWRWVLCRSIEGWQCTGLDRLVNTFGTLPRLIQIFVVRQMKSC